MTDIGATPMSKSRSIIEAIDAVMSWPIDLVVRHFERRLFELAMASVMVALGLFIMASPASLEVSALRYLLAFTSNIMIVGTFFFFGMARIVALGLNGNWMPWGGYVRAAGAAIGSVMWSQWAAAFYQLHASTHTQLSLGIVPFCCLAFFETIAFYRALAGATISHGQSNLRAGVGDLGQDTAHPGSVSGVHPVRSGLADTAGPKGPQAS